MKRRILVLLLASLAVAAIGPRRGSAETTVSISFFHDELSPYGRWVTAGRYGDCWVPSVAAGWQPYTDGEWIYTDYGWTWVSYDPWGGDPFHYGTWVWEPPYGWVWVPGTIWGPAWVTWCYSDSFVGWAPIPPSLEISFSGYFGPAVTVSRTAYVFVPVNRFVGVRVTEARLPVQQNTTLLARTRRVTSFSVSNGVVVNRGPSVQRIEAAAHTRIPRSGIDAAKSRPVPLSASGAQRGKRVAVVAPAPVRARELRKGAGGAPPPAAETRAGKGAKPEAPRHEAAPKRKSTGRGAPPEHPRAESAPPRHEIAPRHEAPPPPAHREAPPPRHEAKPRHEAPPPPPPPPVHHEAARREAPPPHREAPPPGHASQHRPPPPHKEPPPPPPPAE